MRPMEKEDNEESNFKLARAACLLLGVEGDLEYLGVSGGGGGGGGGGGDGGGDAGGDGDGDGDGMIII